MKNAAVLVLLCCSVVAVSQQPAGEKPPASVSAAQPATADDINRLVEVMHIKKQMTEMQHTILDQYKPMVEKMTAEQMKTMTPQQRQKFQGIMADMMSDSLKAYPPDEMIRDMVPIYQKYLDRSDVEAMVAFYSSPAGQKFLNNQPKIVRDFMTVLMPKMQDRMKDSMQKMQDRIRDLVMEGRSQPAQEDKDKEFKPATPEPPQK